jgi:hypothetical protein
MEEYLPLSPENKNAEEYNKNLPGMGGIYNSRNLQTYHYAGNNPIVYSDPTGESVVLVIGLIYWSGVLISLGYATAASIENYNSGTNDIDVLAAYRRGWKIGVLNPLWTTASWEDIIMGYVNFNDEQKKKVLEAVILQEQQAKDAQITSLQQENQGLQELNSVLFKDTSTELLNKFITEWQQDPEKNAAFIQEGQAELARRDSDGMAK